MEAPNFAQAEGTRRAQILDVFAQSLEKGKEVLSQMDDEKLASTWTLTNGGRVVMALPRIAILRAILLNHLYHHRGQLSVYLRLLDVPVPSIYGPSADENPFA
jgi:uncharacterized damage-inducible protein DinB